MTVYALGNEPPLLEPGAINIERVENRVYFFAEVERGSALIVCKLLREAAEDAQWRRLKHNNVRARVWLHINSPGGNVFSMFAIADAIQALAVPVYTVIDGLAASAASIIALAGAKRYITPNSFILIHQLSGWMWGKHEEFKDELNMQEKMMAHMIAFYAARTSLGKKEIRRCLKRDWWMDAREARQRGFVDKIGGGQ